MGIDQCVNKILALTELRLHTDTSLSGLEPYNDDAIITYTNIGCYECLPDNHSRCEYYDKPTRNYQVERTV